MNRTGIGRLLVALIVSLLVPAIAIAAAAPTCHATTAAQRGALIELYTSEGCSSCPPADRWFAQLASTADPTRLSLLAFHVDYWDSIGWLDRFGSGAFSDRQHDRVANAGSRAVYTPQAMLGERVGLPWDMTNVVIAGLRGINSQASPLALDLGVMPVGHRLDVTVKAMPLTSSSLPNSALYLALYENGLTTQVEAGENSGALMHHERVVRQLLGPYPLSGTQWARVLHVVPPHGAHPDRLGLTAFVQSRSGDTQQALSMPLESCAR